MTSRSVSTAKCVSRTLQMCRRQYSSGALLEKGYDALAMSMKLSDKRSWPEREESFAAAQLAQQKRDWNNFRQFGTNSMRMHLSRRTGATPRRNSMIAQRNAKSRRSPVAAAQQQAAWAQSETHSDEKQDLSDESDEDVEVGTVRDVIFGNIDKDNDQLLQRKADQELLSQVTRQRTSHQQALSKKVIAPYSTYNNHRSTWAAFRHRMIYGVTEESHFK
ncbi:uncharacterized protein LOC108655128 [Drosophila navojoa]|uniref:uncharacterized protein LOC108655128 n=1 Tax=Drosophila navojoa TaxID=7232 RepID=UPI000846D54B|nr:uncharacterized protein LOC108655128 [Drosophila navojoa]